MTKIYYPNCSSLVAFFEISNALMMYKILNVMQKEFGIRIIPKPTYDKVLKLQEETDFSFTLGKGGLAFELQWNPEGEYYDIHFGEDNERTQEEVDDLLGGILDKFKEYVRVDRV